ncbi:hypothetical protein EN01_022235 [Vibrio parahaemolyticus]|nr:hypothetical protein EN01_022235 [Vibrio parahaemolyticus]OQU36086.1 hypothetical protein EM67_012845 [Vibrio parahaemolyticus]
MSVNQGHASGPFLCLLTAVPTIITNDTDRLANDWIVEGYCFCPQHPGQYAPFKIQQEQMK